MRVLLQRVSSASVTVEGATTGAIVGGLLLLVGVGPGDGREEAQQLADKVATLRIFSDDAGKFNRSLLDVGGAALVVSQFTLYADTRKGRRPSFIDAAPPEQAAPLVDAFAAAMEAHGIRVERGVFGAHMQVALVNDGPVTIMLESAER
ncbi:MAG: D-tyrosyl-tRNA(Tyr) deacylase [Chloroflexales bacterium]|nr:D-tyrosyl-tRNA(Tyr) deacylase [Chloroflexales bacterium]